MRTARRIVLGRRWARRIIGILAVLVLVLVGVWFTVTRSWFIEMVVQPYLIARLGGEVSISRAAYVGDGRFIFHDVLISSSTLSGPPGQIARFERVLLRIDMGAIWKGDIKLTDVRIFDLHLRISEDEHHSGQMNFMTLEPNWERGPTLPPTVRIDRTVVEVGTHDGETFQLMGFRLFSGVLHPLDMEEGVFGFELHEIDANHNPLEADGVNIVGNWNATTFEIGGLAEGLQLDDATYRVCPSLVRLWWEQMELNGRVFGVNFNYLPGEHFDIGFSVENVELTLPIETDNLWARFVNGRVESSFDRPRLYVRSGMIHLSSDELRLENLVGSIGSSDENRETTDVPYDINVKITSIPPLDWDDKEAWVAAVLEKAPFRMDFRIEDFIYAPDVFDEDDAVDLPAPIARVLEKFNMTRWELSTEFTVQRLASPGGPDADDTGPTILVSGDVYIDKASGAYDKFPYPLENVSVHVEFDHRRIIIHELTAEGSGQVPIRMTGEITPLGKNAAVQLQLSAKGVPLDDRLRGALNDSQRSAYDAFLHRDNYESLVEAGLLDDRDFQFGGSVDLNLVITRAEGPDQRINLTGDVDIHSLGIVYEHFPYPFTVRGGRFRLLEDRIVLVDDGQGRGIPISMMGGGQGFVSGEVLLTRADGELRTHPRLHIEVEEDSISDVLIAAVPVARPENDETSEQDPRPDSMSGLLQGLGLRGRLDYRGDIFRDETGRFNYDFGITMRGASTPSVELAHAIGAEGLVWPRGFSLQNVRSEARITRDVIELRNFQGHDGDTVVSVSGQVDLTGEAPRTTLAFDIDHLELGSYLVNLMPGDSGIQAREMWERYRPSGFFDLDLAYESRGDDVDLMEIRVHPDDIGLILDGQPMTLSRRAGELRLLGGRIEFDDLQFELQAEGRFDGVILLDGAIETRVDAGDLRLHATWRDGRLESPLIPEMLHLVGTPPQIEQYRRLDPVGMFDVNVTYESPREDHARRFDVVIEPRTVSISLNDQRIDAQLAEGVRIFFEPGTVRFQDLVGSLPGGRFHLDGRIVFEDRIDIDLDVEYDGSLRTPEISALLPERIRQWADEVKFTDGPGSSLRHGRLHLQETELEEGDRGWDIDFSGQFQTTEAAFSLGLALTEMAGTYVINFSHGPHAWPEIEISADLEHLRIVDREVESLSAYAYFDHENQSIQVPLIKGNVHGGKISGSARFSVGEKLDYDFQLSMAGVGLDGIINPVDGSDPVPAPASADETIGKNVSELFGTVRFVGERGKPDTRIGRGVIRAIGGRVASVPLALRIVQVIQSVLPLGGDLDYFEASFFIEGDALVFEEIVIENRMGTMAPIQLFGTGMLHLQSLQLDLQFRVRTGPPIIREVVGGIGDQILSINVTGPLNDPKANLQFLPGLQQDRSSRRSRPAARVVQVEDERED